MGIRKVLGANPKRMRVREKFTPQQLQELYGSAHVIDAKQRRIEDTIKERAWILEHPETRTFQNTAVALGIGGAGKVDSIADMSCGTGDIARKIAAYSGIEPLLGEFGGGYDYQGTLQDTVPQLPVVDLFICTETVEHLDDPDADLALIREHTRMLLLSTPVDEDESGDGEPLATGHYWAWSREGVEDMLNTAGFEVSANIVLDMTPGMWTHCKFGMWFCR